MKSANHVTRARKTLHVAYKISNGAALASTYRQLTLALAAHAQAQAQASSRHHSTSTATRSSHHLPLHPLRSPLQPSQPRNFPPPSTRHYAQTTKPPTSADPIPEPTADLTEGLNDTPLHLDEEGSQQHKQQQVDWSRSFHGLSTAAFPAEAAKILTEPVPAADIEIKPDGIIYLPEIKYRRILNRAFGPGAWGLAPRGATIVTAKSVTREYGMVVQGRLVSIARGEQAYFDPEGIPTATEGCKSNALMRCCKDLGVASELWDPRFIRKFIAEHVKETWVEHVTTGRKRKVFLRKEDKVQYPFKETTFGGGGGSGGNGGGGGGAGSRGGYAGRSMGQR